MKPFIPFLLIPVVAVFGWGLAAWIPPGEGPVVPAITAMESPPLLGRPAAAAPTSGPVRVRMSALLPPASAPPIMADTSVRQSAPEVTAILVQGARRVAQIDGMPMVIGEARGVYRITAIEPDRVLFMQTLLGRSSWVSVTNR